MWQDRRARLCTWVMVLAAVLAALVGVSAARAASPVPAATDWPQWRGPERTGISSETGWRTDWAANPPKSLWKAALGQGYSSVAVVAGRVYTMGNTDEVDTVWCLAADTGQVLWKHSYPCKPHEYEGTRATPTVDGNSVYTLSNQGDLFCLDAASGKVKWQLSSRKDFGEKPPQWGFACSPLVLGDRLIIDVGPVIALDKATGKVAWKGEVLPPGYGSPIAFKLGSATLVASFDAAGPIVVNAADGKTVGKAPWKTSYDVNAVTPIIVGNTFFISSGYNVGAAVFEIGRGELKALWKNKNMRNHANNCVLSGGCLYGPDGQVDGPALVCIDYKTGQKKWAQKDPKAEALMIADSKLIIMSAKGELVVAEAAPDTYKEIARTTVLTGTCWTMPVLSGGRIYCRNHPGDLVCLDVRGK